MTPPVAAPSTHEPVTLDDRARGAVRLVVPAMLAVASIGLLLYDESDPLTPARLLAAVALTLVLVHLGRTFSATTKLMREREHEALTDALTGLPNRRALGADLETVVQRLQPGEPALLAVFDLDGFKDYNDVFGHTAGDALLVRLSAKLSASVAGLGRAYRMGGDEFCVIVRSGEGRALDGVQRAAAALTETGDGFAIGSSHGIVHIPDEARDAETALRVVDRRLGDSKGLARSSARGQIRDVLLAALSEHNPELGDHTRGVRELAEAVARRLGLDAADVDLVGSTADLHDIGKVAIPRSILDKTGALDAHESSFMRRHTLIGERIISAAPALSAVALAVRSSHERWDGAGYPDGLVGADCPLAARIVAVCDAFDAMIADRPYAAPRSVAGAIRELRRCSGHQFDPTVVDAFEATVADRIDVAAGVG
jgi:diguanylate cyclase (GGDEF)-like protein